MDPVTIAGLLGAGSSLLGGLFGMSNAAADRRFNAQQIKEQNEYNKPINIRKRAEEGGFNPLSFIGPGVGLQTGVAQANSGNYMGAAIADAGMAMADSIANRTKVKQAEQLGALEIENAKLQNKLMQLTLRPKVEGVYAQRETTPTIAAAVGGGNGQNYTSGAGGSVSGQASSGGGNNQGAVEPKSKSTFDRFVNDGQSTDVPIGPDIDEVITGALIAANNRDKARKAFIDANAHHMTFGQTLHAVPFFQSVSDFLPPPSVKPQRQPGQTSDAYWKKQRVSAWWQ